MLRDMGRGLSDAVGWIARASGCARDVTAWAMPGVCAGCEDLVEPGHWLCEACSKAFVVDLEQSACPKCSSPIPEAGMPCGRCRGVGVRPFHSITRLANFEHLARALVHRIKYQRRWDLIEPLADELASRLMPRLESDEPIAFVPIPLHWRRHLHRGYNQSELLARALAERCEGDLVHLLRRTRPTVTQIAYHSRAARQRNVRGVFARRSIALPERSRIVLVDDVMTSGATLREAAKTLLPLKPLSIDVAVIATAHPLRSDVTIN
jgi:ComF family protein